MAALPEGGHRRRIPDQLSLFTPAKAEEPPGHREVIETLKALDVERMTLLDALKLLARLKDRCK